MSSVACAFISPRRSWEDEFVAGVSEGVAVRPSTCKNGCTDESCCSRAAGSKVVLATAEGEWQTLLGFEPSPPLPSAPNVRREGGVAKASVSGRLYLSDASRAALGVDSASFGQGTPSRERSEAKKLQ